ncbi:type II secretion system protein GspG [Acaryochloris thomasi]|uniref:type II secretion system protein GspG n=1 Tax=Acaryochloris thomasi TaxID=2929456 RepID=UPI001F212B70|nr:type II secretion system protein GspG [Acaryochloris thomasi]
MVSGIIGLLGKAFLDAISIPRSSVTPTAVGETHYRIYLFAKSNHRLPKSLSELPPRQGYVNSTVDLWGRELIYKTDDAGIITLGSYGQDGIIGGAGDDADILYRYRSRDESGQFIAANDLWVVEGRIHPENGG